MMLWLKKVVFIPSIILISFSVSSLQSDEDEESCSATIPPLVHSINDFGFQLTKHLESSDNIFVSTFSIFAALALTYLGADGKTAAQMQEAFQLCPNGISGSELPELFRELDAELQNTQDSYKLLVANALFLQKYFKIKQQFNDDAVYYYNAAVQTVDFANNGEMAMETINEFAADKTNNLIPEFLKEPLDSSTKLLLLNAIYFKGTWKTEFPKNNTEDDIFYMNGGDTNTVQMMRLNKQKFRYYEDEDCQYLELPYDGDDVSMLLILPVNSEEAPDSNVMDSNRFSEINESLKMQELEEVAIPKFRLQYNTELTGLLQQLGIKDLFTPSADLSGISDEQLEVSTVLHEAVIEVNEEGTEAAAVTAVGVRSLGVSSRPKPSFVANHPFSLYILHERTGLILFSGQIYNL